MKKLLLFLALVSLIVCYPLYAAQLPCTITIDTQGNASAQCVSPPITPTPPTPPAPIPPPSGNVITHDLLSEGSNNYIFDGDRYGRPLGSIQALRLPLRTSDGRAINAATFNFTDYIVYTPSTLQVEIAFSPTAGDFTYYKSDAALFRYFPGQQPYYPCGMVAGAVATISHAPEAGYDACAIPPGAQWFLNWRIVGGCDAGRSYNCGQVLIWHRTY